MGAVLGQALRTSWVCWALSYFSAGSHSSWGAGGGPIKGCISLEPRRLTSELY